ncbi:MAG: carbohydrate binding domain-containing protein, partial [Lentisphaeria bacterium]|nr:carbohydrate binding domain-containing protein [Lentisphaeria bacterium]
MKWKSHVLEALVLLFFALFSIPSSFAQMPENGGFEERGTAPPKGCLRFFSKAWTVALNSGAAHCDARLAGDALEGAYCLELINRTPGRFISASQNVPVSPGREVTASVYVKGTSGARCLMRFHFLDSDGNRVGKYKTMGSSTAPAKWTRRNTRFIVPPHVQNMQITVENLLSRKAASVFFDKYELSVGSGTLLENEWIRASVNPMLGGCLDSVVLRKGGDVELTRPNGMTAPGGMAVDMIPGGKFPGLVRAARYECEVLEPLRRIRVWHVIASRKLNGLKVEKTYSTPANLAGVRVAVKLSNGSREPMAFTYRVHNVLKAAAGTYTWPTADWLQAYHRDLGGNGFLQDIKTENLKSGWIGRSFAPKPHGILFQFENRSVAKAYSYFGQELETVEWYYRRISLAPGQAWETTYTVYALGAEGAVFGATGDVAFTVTPTEFPNEACKVAVCSLGGANAGEFTVNGIARRIALSPGRSETMDIAGTVDKVEASLGKAAAAVGQGYRVEYVQGIDLPEPPAQRPVLPSVMQGYFPYAIDSPPISFPEAAGSSKDRLRHLYSRIIREARRDYFNTFYNGRMVQPGYLKQLVTSDGKHEFGELARKYNMRFVTNTALFGRDDVDLAEFAPRLKKKLDFYFTPQTRRFLATYHDRLLCYFTGDEPMGKNIPAMLEAHAAMRSIDPDRVCLPYLNLNRYEYAPYVPVYLGDFYPIKHKDSGGRNPWSMQGAVTQAVSKAGPGVPVWVMPQGFAYFRGTYALATAEEMRLMLYGAVANGCKGIVFHGWAGEIPWRTKYGYHYSYFDMRPTRPLWNAISECGRELTAFGHLLFNANPERAFRGATVVCEKFVSHDRF